VKVVLAGGSGFIGGHLAAVLRARGDSVAIVSLRDLDAAVAGSRDADAIVNLAGASLAKRWTEPAKREIRDSRIDTTRAFVERLGAEGIALGTYVGTSAVGYYGTSESEEFAEGSAPGDDFLAQVCIEWEREHEKAASLGARVVRIRNGLVLGTDGGALPLMLPPFRAGLGGHLASGRQWVSWVHIDDVVAMYVRALERGDGVYNATAPQPLRNAEFTKILGATLHRPALFPVPAFALATLLGEGAMLLTEGQRVLPERTLASGYSFKFPSLQAALEDLLRR